MDRKDWLGPLFAVSVGVFGALDGSLDALKMQNEEAQSLKASTQTVTQLKR